MEGENQNEKKSTIDRVTFTGIRIIGPPGEESLTVSKDADLVILGLQKLLSTAQTGLRILSKVLSEDNKLQVECKEIVVEKDRIEIKIETFPPLMGDTKCE